MAKKSAGILLYRFSEKQLQVMLVHPGGPFFAKKDLGAWSIPKGEFTDEDPLLAAKREFQEETGISIEGEFKPLDPVKQKGGKEVHAWAVEGDLDVTHIQSNTFELEWPPRTGKYQSFPEVDRGEWFDIPTAKKKINAGQWALIAQLEAMLR